MISSAEVMQQIRMDCRETEKISKNLIRLSTLCQKYAIVSQSSDCLRIAELENELEKVNDQISQCVVGIYMRRNALKDGIVRDIAKEV